MAHFAVEFVRFTTFERTAAGLLSETDNFEVELLLTVQPDAGDYHVTSQDTILLITAYAKNQQRESRSPPNSNPRRPREIRVPMKEADFPNLLQGIREAGAYLRGKKKTVARVDRIDPESVAANRAKLRLSQKALSSAFGIGPATLRNWEQRRRQPTGAARVLLRVAAKHPKAALEADR